MPKYTPGPWTYVPDELGLIRYQSGFPICQLFSRTNKDRQYANGRLIAAAPTTYDLLIEALALLEGEGAYWDTPFEKRVSAHLTTISS